MNVKVLDTITETMYSENFTRENKRWGECAQITTKKMEKTPFHLEENYEHEWTRTENYKRKRE